MKKTLLLILWLTISSLSSHAQRFGLNELIGIYKLTLNSTYNPQAINKAIHNNASNWGGMESKRRDKELTLRWQYKFDEATTGLLYVLKDDDPILPSRLIFKFPYAVQYNEYLSIAKKNAELVNVSSEGGKKTQVFETGNLVIALSIYPPAISRYYDEGKPAPLYEIFLQEKRH